jgi:hypothetical protein
MTDYAHRSLLLQLSAALPHLLYQQGKDNHHIDRTQVKKSMQPSTIRWHLIHTNDTCPYLIQIESHYSIITQIRVLSDSQTLHLTKTNSQQIWHEAPIVITKASKSWLTLLIFSPFGNKHQKRRKKSTNSLLLDILPVNVVASTSSTSTSSRASTCSSPCPPLSSESESMWARS